ncbi:HAMP domain-containing sensor histidine kinase [Clostridium sediminicola]|uniref:sensor histidine kinase n=1 Tax=Clostridium sediminicola TaxID=3114879 RepID=UPI0031F224BE
MKKTLALKMFLMIFSLIILTITVIITAQWFYFNKYYETHKINSVISNINSFTTKFEDNKWDYETVMIEGEKFSADNTCNFKIKYFDRNDQVENRYIVVVYDEERNLKQFFISEENYNKTLKGIEKGDLFNLKGYTNDTNTLRVMKINDKDIGKINTNNLLQENYFEGKVVFAKAALYSNSSYEYKTRKELSIPTKISKIKDGVRYVITSIPYSNYKEVNFIKQVSIGNKKIAQIYVNTSLQSIEEASSALMSFSPYLLIFAIVISAIMSFFYSKTVSKPIIEVANVANEMANMNFSIKTDIIRNDELGILAGSINTLSEKLLSSINQLKTANKQLEKNYAEKLKQEKVRKEFIANASHELKTPLGVIKSFSEAVRDNIKKEKREYYISVILDEAEKMDELIIEMLQLSKLDEEKIIYIKEKTDLEEMIKGNISIFKEDLLEYKNVKIKSIGKFPKVNIDKSKFEKVITNLLSNAVKYCNNDSEIIIKGTSINHKTKVEFFNECTSFTEEQLQRVWDRFYKIDISHSRETGGTGLGLSIVKTILEGHGCEYGVENTDYGVVFWFVV